jgi:hypothetical protein
MREAFARLVTEVAEHSKIAAKYLEQHGNPRACYLSSAMTWNLTPAGHDFWSNIARKIPHGWES